MSFPRVAGAEEYYGKCCAFFIYNNGKVWKNRKINVIDNLTRFRKSNKFFLLFFCERIDKFHLKKFYHIINS